MIPTDIKLHKASKTLTLTYASGEEFTLPAEFLRVHSPPPRSRATANRSCNSASSTLV